MNRYDILLMDADNTLYDFDRTEREALTQTFASRGISFAGAAETLYRSINTALWDAFDRGEVTREFLSTHRFSQFQRQWLGEEKFDSWQWNDDYQHLMGDLPYLLPHAEEVCARLAERGKIYIVTNGLTIAQKRVKESAITPYFSGIFISQEMNCQKPQPEFFRQVFQALGLGEGDKSRVLMIGDNPISDVLGGQNFGLDTVWLRRKGQTLPEGVRPTYLVETLRELLPIVEGTAD